MCSKCGIIQQNSYVCHIYSCYSVGLKGDLGDNPLNNFEVAETTAKTLLRVKRGWIKKITGEEEEEKEERSAEAIRRERSNEAARREAARLDR